MGDGDGEGVTTIVALALVGDVGVVWLMAVPELPQDTRLIERIEASVV